MKQYLKQVEENLNLNDDIADLFAGRDIDIPISSKPLKREVDNGLRRSPRVSPMRKPYSPTQVDESPTLRSSSKEQIAREKEKLEKELLRARKLKELELKRQEYERREKIEK